METRASSLVNIRTKPRNYETLLVPFLTPIDPLEYDAIQAFRGINAGINPIEALESLLGESVKHGGASTRWKSDWWQSESSPRRRFQDALHKDYTGYTPVRLTPPQFT